MLYGMVDAQTGTQRRTVRIVVALTGDEKRQIERAAARQLLTVSDYVRRALLLVVGGDA
jgi:uncharacterized protein (DUF1778 family)